MTTQNVQQAIATLESINPLDNQAYEKATIAYMRVQQIPFLILELDEPFHIFRTRTHETNNFFGNLSELAIPPKQAIKSFARCNRPFQPMFYCSDFRPTSYMELLEYWAEGRTQGDELFVTISKWRISKPIKTLIVTSPDPTQRTSAYDKANGHALDNFINQYTGDYKNGMTIFYQFLFDRFRKPAKKDLLTYIITSAYSNLAFVKAAGDLDAVYYPSVPFQGQGVNFAINANFDFTTNFDPILVARNSFVVRNINPVPDFLETNLIQAQSITTQTGAINW